MREGSERAVVPEMLDCVGAALGGIAGSMFWVVVVVVVVVSVRCPAVRMGSRNDGGSRVMGVRSSRTERSNDRLILVCDVM